jgi:hypothetical protein
MSDTSCGCDNLPVVKYQIPGVRGQTGDDGTDGTDGINAFTFTTADFTQPAVNANVTIDVIEGSWAAVGENIWIEQGGTYEVISVNSAISITVENLGYTGNAPPTTNIPTGVKVSPSGIKGTDGSSAAGDLLSTNNLNDVASIVSARSNLGLVKGIADTNTPQVDDAGGLVNGETLFATAAGIESRTAAATRTALGLVVGTNVQAFDALLLSIAGLAAIADRMPYFSGVDTASLATLTAYARTILDDADAVTARVTLGKILPRYGLLAFKLAIDANAANNDNAITVEATRYRIDRITVDNASINLTTGTVGVFTAAGGAGTTLAADQVLTALTASAKFDDLTLAGIAATDVATAGTIYIRTGTAQGAAATFDAYVFGWRLD